MVKYLFPLDYCVKLMFSSIVHLRSRVPEDPAGHMLNFQVDWPEDKERQEAERMANPGTLSKAELASIIQEGYDQSVWELQNQRCWGT